MKVLITTSGIGSRLGNITNYTNKALVKLGKLPIISHIINLYPKEWEIIILTGYFGDHVKQYIEIAHPERHIEFVDVDNYSGDNSSPLYSQFCALSLINEPFIYNSCDTYIPDILTIINNAPKDIDFLLVGADVSDSGEYDSFTTIKNGDHLKISNLYSKKESLNKTTSYVGVAVVYNYELYKKTIRDILLESISLDGKTGHMSDFFMYKNKLSHTKIYCGKTAQWFDIGNVNSLKIARALINDPFNILDKDDQSIFILDDKKTVIKFFSNKEIVKNLANRQLKLNKFTGDNFTYTDNFLMYSFVEGSLLSDVINSSIMYDMLMSFMNGENKLWESSGDYKMSELDKFSNDVHAFYIDKSLSRIKKIKEDYDIIETYNDVINGVHVPVTIEKMLSDVYDSGLFNSIKPTNWHGDFILDNMIYTPDKKIKLLDWRESFNNSTEWGDMYYDLAKLNHNLMVNHEIIFNNNFSVNINENVVDVDIHVHSKMIECRRILHDFINDHTDVSHTFIEFLTGLIWVNMSPLHKQQHPFDLFLFYFGKLQMYNAYKKL